MCEGRDSARMMIVAAALVCLLVHSAPVQAETYKVGGFFGWTFGAVNWAKGKTFKAGDVLEFDYLKLLHNVVEVDKNGYDKCKAPEGAKEHKTGKDKITLKKGANSFICTVPGHCLLGMKVTVNAQ